MCSSGSVQCPGAMNMQRKTLTASIYRFLFFFVLASKSITLFQGGVAPPRRSNQFLTNTQQSAPDTHTHTHKDQSRHTHAKKTYIYFYNIKHKIISWNLSMQIQRLRQTAAAFVSGTQINHFISGMGAPPNHSSQLLTHTHKDRRHHTRAKKTASIFSIWHTE